MRGGMRGWIGSCGQQQLSQTSPGCSRALHPAGTRDNPWDPAAPILGILLPQPLGISAPAPLLCQEGRAAIQSPMGASRSSSGAGRPLGWEAGEVSSTPIPAPGAAGSGQGQARPQGAAFSRCSGAFPASCKKTGSTFEVGRRSRLCGDTKAPGWSWARAGSAGKGLGICFPEFVPPATPSPAGGEPIPPSGEIPGCSRSPGWVFSSTS